MPTLRVEPPDRAPYDVEVRGTTFTVGRAGENDLSVPTLSLSRRHARLSARDGEWFVEDCESRNGTLVNGLPARAEVALRDGDEIRLGDVTLRFRALGSSDSALRLDHGRLAGDKTFVLRREDMSFERFARESRSGEVRPAEALDLWPALSEAAATLITNYPLTKLLEVILDIVFRAVPAQRGALLLRRADGSSELDIRAVRAAPGQPPLQISSTVVRQVLEKQEAVLTVDALADDRFDSARSVRLQGIRSVLCVPLWSERAVIGLSYAPDPGGSPSPRPRWNERAVIGLIYVDNLLAEQAFAQSHLRLLGLIANMAAVKVENTRLLAEQLEKERLEEQLEVAARIQRRLLPQAAPEIPGYELHGRTQPCHEIGGDYYDFVRLGGDRLHLVIADVSGKGVGAALLMAALQASLRTLLGEPLAPTALIARLNEVLRENSPPERFVTCFFGELDLVAHRLRYVNAGHNPPLLFKAGGGTLPLASTGPVLGLLPEVVYGAREIALEQGDLLFLYTDGATECESARGEEFGLERLDREVVGLRTRPLQEIEATLTAALRDFARGAPVKDDTTLVLLRRCAGR